MFKFGQKQITTKDFHRQRQISDMVCHNTVKFHSAYKMSFSVSEEREWTSQ